MSPLYILDTNILLALVRGQALGQRIDEAYALSSATTRPIISIVTEAELRTLARVHSWGEQKLRTVSHLLENVTKVPVHVPEVMAAYVEIELVSRAHPRGARTLGKNDVWIAATARATGAVLMTTDADFDHLNPDVIRVIRISLT